MNGESLIVCGVLFLAALARASLGFGDALVAMPLLALMFPARVAAPIVALTAIVTAGTILIRDWKSVTLRAGFLLTFAGLAGIPLGVWLLRRIRLDFVDVRSAPAHSASSYVALRAPASYMIGCLASYWFVQRLIGFWV